jgi:DNA-binding protein HU-beta
MNRNELIASVAGSAGISKADATRAIGSVLDTISNTLAAGEEVRLIGFGTFGVANRAASVGRNPRTGEAIQIAAATRPKFKAGKALKDAVNK